MFKKKIIAQVKSMVDKWYERVSEREDKKKMEVKTAGGIPIKPFYTLHDMENHDFKEISIPGEFPYTRGFRDVPYSLGRRLTLTASSHRVSPVSTCKGIFLMQIDMLNFEDKVILITGVTTAIGRDTAIAYVYREGKGQQGALRENGREQGSERGCAGRVGHQRVRARRLRLQ